MKTTTERAFALRFSERLTQARQSAGMTQLDLATELDWHRREIVHYESGTRVPGAYNLFRLANALGVTMDSLCD
jgi:transcriptional regulator with XRE-family HTH domain